MDDTDRKYSTAAIAGPDFNSQLCPWPEPVSHEKSDAALGDVLNRPRPAHVMAAAIGVHLSLNVTGKPYEGSPLWTERGGLFLPGALLGLCHGVFAEGAARRLGNH